MNIFRKNIKYFSLLSSYSKIIHHCKTYNSFDVSAQKTEPENKYSHSFRRRKRLTSRKIWETLGYSYAIISNRIYKNSVYGLRPKDDQNYVEPISSLCKIPRLAILRVDCVDTNMLLRTAQYLRVISWFRTRLCNFC